jgi:hypothetical protein
MKKCQKDREIMKRKSSVVSPYLWQEGKYIRPAQFFLLALLLLSVSANDIQKNFIAQDNACAGGSNTITITLQVATCSPQLKLHSNCLATPVHLTLPSTPHHCRFKTSCSGHIQGTSKQHPRHHKCRSTVWFKLGS